MGRNKRSYLPLLLTACVILADQLSKAWIVRHIAENTVGYQYWGDFLAIVHVRNTAIAFSMGDSHCPRAFGHRRVRGVFFQTFHTQFIPPLGARLVSRWRHRQPDRPDFPKLQGGGFHQRQSLWISGL